MSDRSALLPTATAAGYGAAPASAPKAQRPATTTSRVLAAVAGVAGVAGVVAFRANGAGSAAALGGVGPGPRDPIVAIADIVGKHGDVRAALAQSRAQAVRAMTSMTVRPISNVPGRSARLGESEYEKCVAHGAAPSDAYNVTDENLIRADLTFDVSRDDFPAVTSYNDSKALLMSVGCEIPPPATFMETPLCEDEETSPFCDKSCSMPLPENCAEDSAKDFGSCEPTVKTMCDDIQAMRTQCQKIKAHVAAKEAGYNALEVGHLPCRTTPDAPFAKAAYAQVKYEEAYMNWVDSVNDATEVCTIGHALWVHNLGLYQAHYDKIRETTDDLIEMCDTANSGELDMNTVIEDTEESFFETSSELAEVWPEQELDVNGDPHETYPSEDKEIEPESLATIPHDHPTLTGPEASGIIIRPDGYKDGDPHTVGQAQRRRHLVWWQQLCDPTIAAMEALLVTLEIASPQLKCFAETCQAKKNDEAAAFDELVKAYNKFVIGYAKYSDETAQYNERVVNKNTALAVVVSAFETFHPSKDEYALRYDSLVEKFEKFDSGDRRAVQGCGLTDCQVEAICTNKLKNKFESLVNVETCSAAKPPTEACKPVPSPPSAVAAMLSPPSLEDVEEARAEERR